MNITVLLNHLQVTSQARISVLAVSSATIILDRIVALTCAVHARVSIVKRLENTRVSTVTHYVGLKIVWRDIAMAKSVKSSGFALHVKK